MWKQLLARHDRLCKRANATLYDRVKLLTRVWEDPKFIAAMGKEGKSPIAELDLRVCDTCTNFTELREILKLFPKKEQWRENDLITLRNKMIEAFTTAQKEHKANTEKKSDKNGRKYKQTATLEQVRTFRQEVRDKDKEIQMLKEQLQAANKNIASLEKQLEAARETIGSLNETIALFKLELQKREQSATKE